MSSPPPSSSSSSDTFLHHAVSCSMIDLLDKEIMCILRDGKQIIGNLITFDQYSNIVLIKAKERRMFNNEYYSEESLGLAIIRGENIVLLGIRNKSELNKSKYSIEANPNKYIKLSTKQLIAMEEEHRKKNLNIQNNELREEEFGF